MGEKFKKQDTRQERESCRLVLKYIFVGGRDTIFQPITGKYVKNARIVSFSKATEVKPSQNHLFFVVRSLEIFS